MFWNLLSTSLNNIYIIYERKFPYTEWRRYNFVPGKGRKSNGKPEILHLEFLLCLNSNVYCTSNSYLDIALYETHLCLICRGYESLLRLKRMGDCNEIDWRSVPCIFFFLSIWALVLHFRLSWAWTFCHLLAEDDGCCKRSILALLCEGNQSNTLLPGL